MITRFSRPAGRRAGLLVVTVGASLALTACGLSQSARSTLSSGAAAGTGGAVTGTGAGAGTGATGTDTGVGATGTDTGAATGTGAAAGTGTATGTGTTTTGTGTTGATGAGTTGTTGATGATGGTGTTGTGGTSTGAGKTTTKSGTTTTTTSGGGSASTTSAACSTAGGNATGINGSTINIGLHAPLTGTGTPFPNSSFVAGSKYYFNDPTHTICNKKINIDFQDDTYTPQGASNVCGGFAKNDFIAVGGAGTDQIQACATQPDIVRTGTPYLSAGVTENGLTGLSNYFAVSLSYRQQSGILVKAAQAGGWAKPAAARTGGQWAIVTASTKNFDDATNGITAALSAAGISYKVFRIDQGGNYQAQATQMGATLALDGYQTIYTLTAPGYFVFETGGYYGQNPAGTATWVGPGVSFTDFIVAQLSCSGSKNAISGHAYYLAPNPGLDRASDAFKKAAGNGGDDIAWGLWGLDELLYQGLQKVAPTGLTRQNFIATLQKSSLSGGSDVPAVFNGSHFGGTGAWEQRIDCSKSEPGQNQPGTWTTVGSSPLAP